MNQIGQRIKGSTDQRIHGTCILMKFSSDLIFLNRSLVLGLKAGSLICAVCTFVPSCGATTPGATTSGATTPLSINLSKVHPVNSSPIIFFRT